MQRQRGELVPVAEVIADLPGPVQALRYGPPGVRSTVSLECTRTRPNAPF